MSLSFPDTPMFWCKFPDTPKKITPAKQVTITIAQTQAAGFVTRARGVRSMSGVRSSFVVAETFGVSTSIVTSRNVRLRGARVVVPSYDTHEKRFPFSKNVQHTPPDHACDFAPKRRFARTPPTRARVFDEFGKRVSRKYQLQKHSTKTRLGGKFRVWEAT
mmetsp:Transcript_8513/g.31845  ORF Transcript_8513/g.31845 Transcript_8513/m.31845 type:complete len:161 (+) Transcript_8513:753-1235(+)